METYEGRGVELILDGDVLVLTKKAMFGKDTTRRIPIQALTEVRFKQAGRLSPGSLQLVVAGEPPRKADFNDPNTVMFLPKFNDSFSTLHDRLAAAVRSNREQGLDPAAVEYDQADPTAGERVVARLEQASERLAERAAAMDQGIDEHRAKLAEERANLPNLSQMWNKWSDGQAARLVGSLERAGITRQDVVEAVVAMAPPLGVPPEVPKLVERLRPDETVRRISSYWLHEGEFGIVALTDVRLMIIDKFVGTGRTEEVPLRVISSVAVEIDRMRRDSDLKIYTVAGHTVHLERVSGIEAFADAVRDEVARVTAPQPAQPVAAAPAPDVLDQLAKLAQLRDAGVVTAEEFEAKKAQLLDRL